MTLTQVSPVHRAPVDVRNEIVVHACTGPAWGGGPDAHPSPDAPGSAAHGRRTRSQGGRRSPMVC